MPLHVNLRSPTCLIPYNISFYLSYNSNFAAVRTSKYLKHWGFIPCNAHRRTNPYLASNLKSLAVSTSVITIHLNLKLPMRLMRCNPLKQVYSISKFSCKYMIDIFAFPNLYIHIWSWFYSGSITEGSKDANCDFTSEKSDGTETSQRPVRVSSMLWMYWKCIIHKILTWTFVV